MGLHGPISKGILGLGLGVLLLGLTWSSVQAIEVTRTRTGVLVHVEGEAAEGFTLLQTNPARLIDMEGNIVHEWPGAFGGDAQLTEEGTLLRASGALDRKGNPLNWGGTQGRLREWTWEGQLIWDIDLADKDWISHHTFHRMPNGNTLIVIWERYSRQEAIQKGRHPNTVNPEGATGTEPRPGIYIGDFWPDKIIEVAKCDPHELTCYETVWEWRAWDHLCNSKKLDCIDINYHIPRPTDITHRSSADFMHVNAIDYDEINDLIVIDSRVFNELYLIDHATGDIVYRWGNPCAWDKKATCPSYMDDGDSWLFGPHGANFVSSASDLVNIVMFDNGWLRPSGNRSRAMEIEVDLLDKEYYKTPVVPSWQFQTASANSLSSPFVSYAQRIGGADGNTLITSGMEGHLIEVTRGGEVVWEYVIPGVGPGGPPADQCENIDGVPGRTSFVFRTYRYEEGYPGIGELNMYQPWPDTALCP
jgi:hypothetical protein